MAAVTGLHQPQHPGQPLLPALWEAYFIHTKRQLALCLFHYMQKKNNTEAILELLSPSSPSNNCSLCLPACISCSSQRTGEVGKK